MKTFTKLGIEQLKPRRARFDITETKVSTDRRGLVLRVEPSGTKRFLLRYKLNGAATRVTLGTYGDITVEEARRRVDIARTYLQKGEQPPPFVAQRIVLPPKIKRRKRRPPSPLFTAVTGSPPPEPEKPYSIELLAHRFYWRFCAKHRKRPEYVARILDADVLPAFVGRDVRTIDAGEVFQLLDAIASRAPVMANRVAAVVTQLFKYAIHCGMRRDTPVQLLARPGGKEKPKERALSDDELRVVWAKIPTMSASEAVQVALRVLTLTGVRRGELAVAKWADVDLDKGEWLIPAAVHKNGFDFLTPLAPTAVAEFKKLKALSKDLEFVMPSPEGGGDKPIDPKAITKAVGRSLEHFGIGHWTPHDLRRTLRTGLGNLKIDDALAERCIGHLVGTEVQRTYNRAAYMKERRAALLKWTRHVEKVVSANE